MVHFIAFTKKLFTTGALLLLVAPSVRAQTDTRDSGAISAKAESQPPAHQPPSTETAVFRRHSLGSSLFMSANLFARDEPPSFYQVNYAFRLTRKDVISLEAITWKYYAPLGIPYGDEMSDPANNFPGAVRAAGVGVAYQRFIWKGSYAAIHALPLRQTYFDEDRKRIQSGFQLFLTLRAGYHIALHKDRFFIEPSIAMTAWPVNTNVPASFAVREREWPRYFLAEPGLHFGVKF